MFPPFELIDCKTVFMTKSPEFFEQVQDVMVEFGAACMPNTPSPLPNYLYVVFNQRLIDASPTCCILYRLNINMILFKYI